MSVGLQFFLATILVYFGVNAIAALGLNLQYGVAGIMNFGFVLFQAAGAYATALVTIGAPTVGDYQHYFFGASLPWPLPLLVAALVGGVLSLVVGSFALRPRERGYQAMALLVVLLAVLILVESQKGWLNGTLGLTGIPAPFQSQLSLSTAGYKWFYSGLTLGITGICVVLTNLWTSSPFGRRLRAMRDNSMSASALGVNVSKEAMTVFVIGGMLAGLSGGILVQFIGEWSTASWSIFETFLFLAAIIVGGTGNNGGVLLGEAVVATGIIDGVEYIPGVSGSALVGAVGDIAVALLLVLFLWLRPQGLLPERRRKFPMTRAVPPAMAIAHTTEDLTQLRARVVRTAGRMSLRLGAARARTAGTAPPGANDGVISVVNLYRSFGGVRAVDGATFAIDPARITALIGPNGAGKSTVLGVIAGTDKPDAGAVFHRGARISGLPPHKIAHRGVIRTFQLSNEFANMTVLENVLVAAPNQRGRGAIGALGGKWYWGRDQEARVTKARQLIEQFELTKVQDHFARELSGGQKRLLEIARALMAEPDVLLLDEPLVGVAPALREEIQQQLARLRDGGLTMLMVEHALDVVEQIADSVIVMGEGRVIATGQMAELRANEEVMDAFLVS